MLRALHQMGTDAVSAHLDRAWELLSQGDLRGARASARRVLQLEGDSPEAHNLLGQVSAQEGDHEGAMEHFRTAMALDDGYVDPMLSAAELLVHPLRDYDGAIELCDEVLEFVEERDEVLDAMLLKLDAMLGKRDEEGARRVLDALPEGPYEQPGQSYLVGRALFETGYAERAEAHLVAALEADDQNADAHYYLALVRDALRDWRGATVSFLRARELDREAPPPPWTLPREQIEKIVQRALTAVAPPLARHLDGALVLVDDLPGVEVVADGVDPRAPVLVDGVGYDGPDERAALVRVFLYQRNLELLAGSAEELEDEITRQVTGELEHLAAHARVPDAPRPTATVNSPRPAAEPADGAARKPRKPRT